MKNNKTIIYIVMILIVLIIIVLFQRYRNCENKKQQIKDYINSGGTSGGAPSDSEILSVDKPCKFWSI